MYVCILNHVVLLNCQLLSVHVHVHVCLDFKSCGHSNCQPLTRVLQKGQKQKKHAYEQVFSPLSVLNYR